MKQFKEGDEIIYSLTQFQYSVKTIKKDENGELYVEEGNLKRYLYKSMEGYDWDTSLIKVFGLQLYTGEVKRIFEENNRV